MSNEPGKRRLLSLEEMTKTAKETTLKLGYHVPTLIIEGDLGSLVSQIKQLADTFEGREAQMFMHGFLLANVGEIGSLQQVFFISEGWMSVSSKDNNHIRRHCTTRSARKFLSSLIRKFKFRRNPVLFSRCGGM